MSMMRKNYNYLPTNSSPYFYSHFKILFQIIAIRYGKNGAYPFTFPIFSCILYVETNLTYNIRPWQEKQKK